MAGLGRWCDGEHQSLQRWFQDVLYVGGEIWAGPNGNFENAIAVAADLSEFVAGIADSELRNPKCLHIHLTIANAGGR